MKTQNRNKRNSRMITYKGKTKCLSAWCEELNLPYSAISARIDVRNWSIEKAFEQPIRRRNPND